MKHTALKAIARELKNAEYDRGPHNCRLTNEQTTYKSQFTTADLAMLFQGYDLLPFEAIVIRSKSEFGFTAPESHRVGIVRFRSEEEAMLAFREMSPRLRCLHTAEGEYNKILLMH